MDYGERRDTRGRIGIFRESLEDYVKNNHCKDGLSLETKESVLEYVKNHNINSISLWFTDLFGFLKKFTISPGELKGAFELGMGWDGSSIKGYARIQESDMVAKPIAETAQLIPYKIGGSKVLRMFVDVYNTDGTLYEGEPRLILKKVLSDSKKYDLTHANIGPEAEYFYFLVKDKPIVMDDSGYFDIVPGDIGNDLEEVTRSALNSMKIDVEYWHHEVGPSQHEIDLKYREALQMADNLVTHRWLVKEIAERAAGVHATFMPKPIEGENGSGMHTHLSLWRDNRNAFFDEKDEFHLSDFAKKFIAGTLKHAREVCLVTNQWYNSYKRLVPGFEAPVYIAWARRNRSALVRIPEYRPGKEEATRIEIRYPDPACNPYLAFSVLINAGLRGIKKNYKLNDPLEVDLYEMNEIEREKAKVKTLPGSLYDAIKEVENGTIVRDTFGNEITDKLIEAKLKEDMKYRLHVSSLEYEDCMKL